MQDAYRRRVERALSARGYTLIEMMLVVVIIAVALAFFLPAFQNWIQRTRVEGFGRELTVLLRQARSVAVRDGVQVVASLDESLGEMLVFFDRSGVAPDTGADGIFNPIDGLPPGSTDQVLARSFLPGGVEFVAPKNEDVIDGFTEIGNARVAIFNSNGSVRNGGAFRFGDRWGNYLEVRVEPAASAHLELRKYKRSQGGQSAWVPRGTESWEWYWGKGRKGG